MPKEGKRYVFLLIFLFTLSRAFASKFGISTHDTQWLTQAFDISLMQKGLLGNIFYDLYQAPLLNLSIGIFVKLFPNHWPAAMAITFSITSLILILEIYFSLILFNVNRKIAFWVALFILFNPALIYYERYIIYHTPVAFLLVNAVMMLQLYLRKNNIMYLFLTYLSLAILVCYRTSFTLYWFLFFISALIFLLKDYKRNIIAFSIPLILILGVYVKNQMVFNYWGTSNMVGNNLASFTSYVSGDVKQKAIEENKVSKFYSVGIWNDDMNAFKPYLKDTIVPEKFATVGVLNNPRSGAQISHHHYFKHEILNSLFKDAKYLIFQEPICIVKGFVWGMYVYFMPQGDYVAQNGNLKKIYWWNRIYNIYLTGQLDPIRKNEDLKIPMFSSVDGRNSFSELFDSMDIGKISWFILFIYFGFAWFLVIKIKAIWITKQLLTHENIVLIFIFLNFGFLFFLYTILGSFENNRLRFEIIGLEGILAGLFLNKLNLLIKR